MFVNETNSGLKKDKCENEIIDSQGDLIPFDKFKGTTENLIQEAYIPTSPVDDEKELNHQIQNSFFKEILIDNLFNGSRTDMNEFFMAIFSLKIKHNLNTKTIDDILKLFNMVLPEGNKCPKSFSKIEKFLSFPEKNYQVYFFCHNCNSISQNEKELSILNTKKNICDSCLNEISPFVTFDIESQIRRKLQNANLFKQIIKMNLERSEKNSSTDINDGTIYRNALKKSNNFLISLILNTDGAPITNSKHYNMWPLFGTISELEPSSRESFKNMITLGIWLSKEKPSYDHFIRNSVNELIDLKDKICNINDYEFQIRVQSIIMDLPAKAAVLNIKQFNGQFGCLYCYHPGEHSRIFNKRIYPPAKFEKRNDDAFKLISQIAAENKEPLFGIKGINPLQEIISLPSQAPLDYMHLILQGHSKWLIKQFFFSDRSNDYFIGHKITEINGLLKKQKVPHNISRSIKLIDDKLKLKSNELKYFLFYQSIPIFLNILPSFYFNIYASYVFAVRILYEPIKSSETIDYANDILENYLNSLEDAFGMFAYDYTAHAHLHLADQVKNHGPLYCHSQFVFEGAIFNFKNRMHGTKGYLNQLINEINNEMVFRSKLDKEHFVSDEIFSFCYKNSNNFKLEKSNFDKNHIMQPSGLKNLNDNDKKIFTDYFKFTYDSIKNVFCGERLYLDKKVYHSLSYRRKNNSNSYTVSLKIKDTIFYGEIDFYFKYDNQEYCFINIFENRLNS
ncbi:unnamed protein product, partial [Brachionus calyciflorus]